MLEDMESLLLERDVPAWYVEKMKKIMHLFPKAYLVAWVKRDIFGFVKMSKRWGALCHDGCGRGFL